MNAPAAAFIAASVRIELPWPPASLSGHNKGHWRSKSSVVSKHREWARLATMEAQPAVPAEGDIAIGIEFYPPDRRSDRCNFPNRMKPYLDGVADALRVNDRRFLPEYYFGAVVPRGKVVISIGAAA